MPGASAPPSAQNATSEPGAKPATINDTPGAAVSVTAPAAVTTPQRPQAVPSARAVPTLPPRLGMALYRFVLARGLNTPTAPADPFGSLLWGLFRRIETVYGLVPVVGPPTMTAPSHTTGAVTGTVGFTVPAELAMGYTVATQPGQGSVSVDATGYFTYIPKGTAAGQTDTFSVTASSSWAATTTVITVPVVVPTTIPTAPITDIGIGAQPRAVTLSPDGRYGYVTASTDPFTGQGTVSVIDTAGKIVVATIGNGGIPTGVAVSPDGATIYLAAPARYDITPAGLLMVDTATNAVSTIVVGRYPSGVAVSPDGGIAYVTDWAHYGQSGGDADTVWLVDTATKAVVGHIDVGHEPHAIAASPDGRRAYVLNHGTGVVGSATMSVIDTEADSATFNTVIATIKVGVNPTAVGVSPDGRRVFVADLYDGSLRVIDTATNQLVARIGIGGVLGGVAVSPDGDRVYVADAQGAIAVIDATTNTLAGAIAVGGAPEKVTVSPDGAQIYVVKGEGQSVSVIPV